MPFHPAVGASYRGGLPAGLTPPISFGGPAGSSGPRVIDERQPGGLFHNPAPPRRVQASLTSGNLAVVGLGLAAVAALIFVLAK